jgi:hypothetical protein
MNFRFRVLGALGLVLVSWLAGCSTAMTPKQAEGVELRRYCDTHKNDPQKCLGFYGFM